MTSNGKPCETASIERCGMAIHLRNFVTPPCDMVAPTIIYKSAHLTPSFPFFLPIIPNSKDKITHTFHLKNPQTHNLILQAPKLHLPPASHPSCSFSPSSPLSPSRPVLWQPAPLGQSPKGHPAVLSATISRDVPSTIRTWYVQPPAIYLSLFTSPVSS